MTNISRKTLSLIKKFGRKGNPPANYSKVDDIGHGWAWWCNNKSLFSSDFDFGLYNKQ